MTVYEFRREVETKRRGGFAPEEPSGIETLTVRADAADIAALLVLIRGRLVADAKATPHNCGALECADGCRYLPQCQCVVRNGVVVVDTVQESAVRTAARTTVCVACGATGVAIDQETDRCAECVAAGYFPVDGAS